jgi:hypothetical protein
LEEGRNRTVRLTNHGTIFSLTAPYSLSPVILIVDTKVTPIWNVVGVIPGYIKDEVVVVGNHRDGEC